MILKKKSGEVVLADLREAIGWWALQRGLLGRSGLDEGEGLLLSGCGCVHSMFMKFPIGLIYLDRDLCVVKIVRRFPPWRISGCLAAKSVVECRADIEELGNIVVGERLEIGGKYERC